VEDDGLGGGMDLGWTGDRHLQSIFLGPNFASRILLIPFFYKQAKGGQRTVSRFSGFFANVCRKHILPCVGNFLAVLRFLQEKDRPKHSDFLNAICTGKGMLRTGKKLESGDSGAKT